MISLRPYQDQAITGLRDVFSQGLKSSILCVPTGGGKTVIFTTIARSAIKNGNRILIVCDRKELINQAKKNLVKLGLFPTIIAPGYKFILNNCYLGSVDTLRNRDLPEVEVVIIDEAHKQSFDKLLHRYKESSQEPLIIGATATPIRTGKQTALSDYYAAIVEPVSIADLLNDGFLVNCRTFAAKVDLSSVKITAGEYNNAALYKEFNKAVLYDGLVEKFEKYAKDKKTLIFNVNVEHSIKTTEALTAHGYSCKHLDGTTPDKERSEILEGFARGDFQILSNCSVLTTGYDEPSIEAIIVNRATKSLPLWLQMIGRGSRPHPGKTDFTVIDMGANCYAHGLYDDGRTWSIYKKPPGSGVAPVKLCEACEAMNRASARFCSECKEPFKIAEKKLVKAEFVEVKSKRGGSAAINLHTATKEELKQYAEAKGYKNSWVYIQLKLREKH